MPSQPSEAPGRLVIVRHGATEWSQNHRHTGRTDFPLLPEGRTAAATLERRLAGHAFSLVLSSPLQRARETCELAGRAREVELSDDLLEWDYGDYDGRTTVDIRAERPGWDIWRDGVVGGETLAEVAARADRVVERARAVGGDVLVFAHAHFLRVLAAQWLAVPADDAKHLVLDPASISVLGYEREIPAVLRWNVSGGDPLAE